MINSIYIAPPGSAPANPNLGTAYFDTASQMLKVWDGNQWITMASADFCRETPEQKAMRELREFLDMKGIPEDEVKEFFDSRRLAERMQEE